MNIYERAGRLLELVDMEASAHRATLGLLGRIKSGEVAIDDVEIDGVSWRIVSRAVEEKA